MMPLAALSPLQRYQQDLSLRHFTEDKAQLVAIHKLDGLYQRLLEARSPDLPKIAGRLWRKFRQLPEVPEKGLYFWGGVGRGKTWLMDIFYESLPFEQKMRVHFHRFMRRVHRELKTLEQQKNPLEIVVRRLAGEACVICFDEFFVSDITDAMILAGLLDGLFRRGVSLVATSNVNPDSLYRDGLQRERFIPTIALLHRHTEVVNVDGGTDYRLRSLEQAELYHWPLDTGADVSLKACFDSLVPEIHEVQDNLCLPIEGRNIMARYHAKDVVWFDFVALCDGPRSQNDYIVIATEYHTVLVSNVPQMTVDQENQARRFINLVDEFYDRNVKLIVSAEKPIEQLYRGQRLGFEFKRTISRLLEMQSHDYLAKAHRP